jgi:hypothetical protein
LKFQDIPIVGAVQSPEQLPIDCCAYALEMPKAPIIEIASIGMNKVFKEMVLVIKTLKIDRLLKVNLKKPYRSTI